jgi:hypothetical protein
MMGGVEKTVGRQSTTVRPTGLKQENCPSCLLALKWRGVYSK